VVTIPHAKVKEMTHVSGAIQKILWLQAAIEHSIQAAWIHALGAKRGTAKVAHIFCEMQLRLGVVGLATQMGFPLPL